MVAGKSLLFKSLWRNRIKSEDSQIVLIENYGCRKPNDISRSPDKQIRLEVPECPPIKRDRVGKRNGQSRRLVSAKVEDESMLWQLLLLSS